MDSWSLAVAAGVLLAYAAFSRRLDRSIVSAAMFFVAGGLILGPEALGWLDLEIESEGVRILAEATLTVVLFTDASRIDIPALWREVGLPARLLGIGLPLTIVAGTLFAAAVLPQLSWAEALILAIILAPTDAALGQAVVSDKRLPLSVRQTLNVESGLNDGICVPLLLIALAIAEAEQKAFGGGHAVRIVAEEIGYGVLGGVVAGGLAALVLRVVEPRGLVAGDWLQIAPLAAAGLSYGIAAPLGGSGFIAAFVGGLVFGGLVRHGRTDITHVSDATGLMLAGVTFVVFGAAALGPALREVDWRIVLYGMLSLTIARMVPVWIASLGTGARWPTVAYAGWFGPRGLASIVFVVLVLDGSNLDHIDTIVVTGVITVALSVFAHGMTAVPLTSAYVRWFAAQPQAPETESRPVQEPPWRRVLG
jgi:NhaP-type Na+/H+ or K+/H+ antiporter